MLTPLGSTYRRARDIRAELKIPKKSTPALPAVVPRLYEGYKTPPRNATQVGSNQRNARGERGTRLHGRTRRANTMPASSAAYKTSVPASTAAHHARECPRP